MLDEKCKIKFSLAGNESYKKMSAGIVFSTGIEGSSVKARVNLKVGNGHLKANINFGMTMVKRKRI